MKDDQGRIHAIEIDMWYVDLKTLVDLIRSVEGVSDVTVRRRLSLSGEKRASFRFRGVECLIVEPWGDGPEYWIGPAHDGVATPDLSPILARLRAHRPPRYRKLLGDLLNLNLKSLFER